MYVPESLSLNAENIDEYDGTFRVCSFSIQFIHYFVYNVTYYLLQC